MTALTHRFRAPAGSVILRIAARRSTRVGRVIRFPFMHAHAPARRMHVHARQRFQR